MKSVAIAVRPDAGATPPVRPEVAQADRVTPDITPPVTPITSADVTRLNAVDALRTFLTLLVVAHHSALAYISFAPPPSGTLDAKPWIWAAFPVVDAQRWSALDLFVGFNDDFFMSLMFLLSGLFVWPILERKGARAFLRDRAKRLGIPFLFSLLLTPIAYFPAYLQRHPDLGFAQAIAGYSSEWLSLGVWPAGPAWFLWVLLAFDVAAAALFTLRKQGFGKLLGGLGERPWRLFLALVTLSIACYLPLTLAVSPMEWLSFGPFFAQTGRLAHYALYFFAGGGISLCGFDRGIFSGTLAKHWLRWSFAGLGAFIVATALFLAALSHGFATTQWQLLANFGFPLSCAASSLAFLAIAQRFWNRGLLVSLSRNAYGLYLFHYVCVSWLQYALLPLGLPAAVKFLAVFAIASTLGMLTAAALRKLPIAEKIL